MELVEETPYRFRIERYGPMRVPGVVYAARALIPDVPADRSVRGEDLRRDLERQGIVVRGTSWRGLAEAAPDAYKDIAEVVTAAEGGQLCRRVARLVPLGVVKG